METNVFPLGFLGVEISLVLSGLPAVVSAHRTLPDVPVGCALADSRAISALKSHSHLSFPPCVGWRNLLLFGCSKSHIPQLRHFHVKPNGLAASSQWIWGSSTHWGPSRVLPAIFLCAPALCTVSLSAPKPGPSSLPFHSTKLAGCRPAETFPSLHGVLGSYSKFLSPAPATERHWHQASTHQANACPYLCTCPSFCSSRPSPNISSVKPSLILTVKLIFPSLTPPTTPMSVSTHGP